MKKFMPLFLCFTFLGEALTISCYKCDSTRNEECTENLKKPVRCTEKELAIPSDGRSVWCATVRVVDTNGNTLHLMRGCRVRGHHCIEGWAKDAGFFGRFTKNYTNTKAKCHTCGTNRCNSVTRMTGSMSLATVSTAMVLMFFSY